MPLAAEESEKATGPSTSGKPNPSTRRTEGQSVTTSRKPLLSQEGPLFGTAWDTKEVPGKPLGVRAHCVTQFLCYVWFFMISGPGAWLQRASWSQRWHANDHQSTHGLDAPRCACGVYQTRHLACKQSKAVNGAESK